MSTDFFSIRPKLKSIGVLTESEFGQIKNNSQQSIGRLDDSMWSKLKQSLSGKTIVVNNTANISGTVPKQKLRASTTNYDPFDSSQTRYGGEGVGAAGIKITPKMIAVSRKGPNSSEPILPYGTVVRVNGQEYLVADIKNKRYHSVHQIDFPTPGKGNEIVPELNKDFDVEVLELGKGRQDARSKAMRFQ